LAGTAGRWLPALLLLLALLFNGSRGLWAPDEGRYVVGAMEMLRRGDFVGIFLNDDTAHFTKPPLTYWSIAAAMAAFGQSEFAARLPNALAFVATALLLLPAGRLLTPAAPGPADGRVRHYGAAIPGCRLHHDRHVTALFTTFAGVAFLHLQAGIAQRRAALALWIGFGFAFLAKGPPTLLALPVFIGWLIVRREREALRKLLLSPGLLLFALIGFGWFLLAEHRFPGLLRYLLGAEVAGRVGVHRIPAQRRLVWRLHCLPADAAGGQPCHGGPHGLPWAGAASSRQRWPGLPTACSCSGSRFRCSSS
jgi:4-amino-4-deoxy-L-arabinose transferase-like glycosyltransferase